MTANLTATKSKQKNRIPLPFNGIQINFCKNPNCKNFGVPAELEGNFQGISAKPIYNLISAGKAYPQLRCNSCLEHFPIKSNQGIGEELERFKSVFDTSLQSCPDVQCSNHKIPTSTPKAYQSFGKTKSGSDRYRCKICKKTFAIGKATRYQKQPEITEQVFKLLVNKSPFRRICEVAGIHPETLYHRIDYLYEQCKTFTASIETQLKTLPIKRLYLSVDRQDYMVNWSQRKDKRNNIFQAVATVDNETRYVFANHLNFDGGLDPSIVELDAARIDDNNITPPFRRYARLWLECDYQKSVDAKKDLNGSIRLQDDIQHTYDKHNTRGDIESLDIVTPTMQLPKNGMQIHGEYTLYGHFFYLNQLLGNGNVEKIRFFLDQDSGIRASCLGAFQKEIVNRSCDVFYVSINKELTVDEKRKRKNQSKKQFDEIRKLNPTFTIDEVKLLMLKKELQRMKAIGKWKDEWLSHPLPDMSETEKAICYLTNLNDYDDDHLAWLYNKASLHGVDSYFMVIRRRISLLERPIHSRSNSGRVWHGYGAYNPNNIVKLLGIFRCFNNYILVSDKDGKTPAMRLGLIDRPVTFQEVINFQ